MLLTILRWSSRRDDQGELRASRAARNGVGDQWDDDTHREKGEGRPRRLRRKALVRARHEARLGPGSTPIDRSRPSQKTSGAPRPQLAGRKPIPTEGSSRRLPLPDRRGGINLALQAGPIAGLVGRHASPTFGYLHRDSCLPCIRRGPAGTPSFWSAPAAPSKVLPTRIAVTEEL